MPTLPLWHHRGMKSDLSLIRFALHGGAGELPRDAGPQDAQRAALHDIAAEAIAVLQAGASALDAVTRAVERLEQCPLFNAGIGAVLNRDGLPELDAAIARGEDRGSGAVAGVSRVASPIRLARAVMEQTPHVLFTAEGAERVARDLGLPMVEPQSFVIPLRLEQLEAAKRSGSIALDHVDDDPAFGTVGAVARDARGHLAAATSTGGLTNKLPGRIGDSAVFGAGTFADDTSCAISCTGTGESFIRSVFGQAVHGRMVWGGMTLDAACAAALEDVRRLGGTGGCIAIGRDGAISLPFNAGVLYRAWASADGVVQVAIRRDDAA